MNAREAWASFRIDAEESLRDATPVEAWDPVFALLEQLYATPARAYHNMGHVLDVLGISM